MLLVIHNLPPLIRYSDVKNLLQEKCGLSDLILDNMLPEGNTKRVTVGVSNEGDAAILVRKINGLYMEGQQLYVEDVRKMKEQQPFRPSSMPEKVLQTLQTFPKKPEQTVPNQLGMQLGYPAIDQSMTMPAQYMVQQQPMPVTNYSMMGYSMPQMQDPNYAAYLNQAFIPGMKTLPELLGMQEQFKTNKSNQGLSDLPYQPASWDDAPTQTNNSQDRWRNDRSCSRSPHRGGFQKQPRSHDQAKQKWNDHANKNDRNRHRIPPWQQPQDHYNSVRNSFERKRSPPRNTPVPRLPKLDKTVFRSEWSSGPVLYGDNPRGPGPRTQAPKSRFHEQRAPRFEEPRNWKNHFTDGQQRHPREGNQGNFGSARFSNGMRDRNWEPSVKKTPSFEPSHFDKPTPKDPTGQHQLSPLEKTMRLYENWKSRAVVSIYKDVIRNSQEEVEYIPEIDEIKSLKEAVRARIDKLLGDEVGVRKQEIVFKYRTKYGPSTDIKLLNLVLVRGNKQREAAAFSIYKDIIRNLHEEVEYIPEIDETRTFKQAIRARINKILGDKIGNKYSKQEIVIKYRTKYGPSTDIKLLNLVLVRVKKQQEAAKAAAAAASAVPAADDKPVTAAPATQDLTGEPALAPVQTTHNEKEDGMTVSIKPLQTGPPTKITKDQIENQSNSQTKSLNKQDEDQDKMQDEDQDIVQDKDQDIVQDEDEDVTQNVKQDEDQDIMQDEDQDVMHDDNQDTVEEAYDENVEEVFSEMEDTDDEQSSDEAEYPHIEEVDLSNVNADELEDY